MRSHGSFEVPQQSEQNPILHQHAVTHDSGTSRSKPLNFDFSPEKKMKGSWMDALSDWWWWELGSVLLSCACFIAIAITLWRVQEKSLSSWNWLISPNALISILATVSKASLMLAVAACISQLKWLYFESAPHQMQTMQIFDDASRGPLGALELLMCLRLSPREVFSHRSGGVEWTLWASVLTILALALDPFAQQLLSFPSRTVPDLKDPSAAVISTSQIYDTYITGYLRNTQALNVDMFMQGAVQNGLYTLNSPVEFGCTTANCTWPTFYALGVCSFCTNVTDYVKVICIDNPNRGQAIIGNCNYTLPSGLTHSGTYGNNIVGDFGPLLNATAVLGESSNNTYMTDVLVMTGITRFKETWRRYKNPEAFECRLSLCAKRYSQVKVVKGEIVTPDIRTWPFKSPTNTNLSDGIRSGRFHVDENTDFNGQDGAFVINAVEHDLLSSWLASQFFTTTEADAVGRVLYTQPNISQTFANIATSMTNRIREGPNATRVFGTSYREETYIHVAWNWLILPGIVVLMGVVLLIASIILSRGDKQGLWKNTILAPLVTHMRGWEYENLRVGGWSEMGNRAKGMRGKLRRDGQGGLEFVRM
jgi:hypothetical protein